MTTLAQAKTVQEEMQTHAIGELTRMQDARLSVMKQAMTSQADQVLKMATELTAGRAGSGDPRTTQTTDTALSGSAIESADESASVPATSKEQLSGS